MKVRLEPILVECRESLPHRLVWRRRHFLVQEVMEHFQVGGRWWMNQRLRPATRRYYTVRVRMQNGGECSLEIFSEHGQWRLSREID